MTPREIAIAIRQRCLALRITPKRLFFEAGVNRFKYINWRCHGVAPKPQDLEKVYAALEKREAAPGRSAPRRASNG
jgi:hypothetical protein